jgi:hypothetical protein
MPLQSVFCCTENQIVELGVVIEPEVPVALEETSLEMEGVQTEVDCVTSQGEEAAAKPAAIAAHTSRQHTYGQYLPCTKSGALSACAV